MAISIFVSCDKDFATIDSDLINEDTFNFDTDKDVLNVKAYNRSFDNKPVQTNTLPYNLLGYFVDPVFGSSKAGFVTQLTPTSYNPEFGENVEIDSVILTLPYFSTIIGTEEDGSLFRLDSVYGSEPLKISIFENAYFLRNIDPNGENIDTRQKYYSNASDGYSQIPNELLESVEIYDTIGFKPKETEIRFRDTVGAVVDRLNPAMRVHLETGFWKNKIIDKQGDPVLSNASNFRNYFRGLYFKAEDINGDGTLISFNLANSAAGITIYYTKDPAEAGAERISGNYAFNFSGNRFNILSPIETPIPSDEINGDERLYLKGGQGSMAVIELFGGENEDDIPELNEFESYRREFSEVDADGEFVRAKKIINEANLVFYVDENVDQTYISDRIYLYDLENNVPLIDFSTDYSGGTSPLTYRSIHLGPLQREGEELDGQGIKYKVRITDHIRNLLLGNGENIKLGLTVSSNLRVDDIFDSQNSSGRAPADVLNDPSNGGLAISSILTPKNVVLHGSTESNGVKKLELEIYYTDPEVNY